MGCIPYKTKKHKQKNTIMTLDHEDSNTSKEYINDNNDISSSSEKIIVLKPLPHKNTLSTQNNNTYIHKDFSSKLVTKPFSIYMHNKTHAMKEEGGVDGLNISKNQNEIIYNTHLVKNINIE